MTKDENLRNGAVIPMDNINDIPRGQIISSTTETLTFRYRNWKGVVSDRTVIPLRIVVKSSEYHNDGKPCWIMTAWDVEKNAKRDFALQDIIQYYSIV